MIRRERLQQRDVKIWMDTSILTQFSVYMLFYQCVAAQQRAQGTCRLASDKDGWLQLRACSESERPLFRVRREIEGVLDS
jgi:hypothetical protein